MADKERIVANVPNQAAVTEKKLGDEVTDIELQASALVIANDDAFRQAGEFGRALKQKAHEVTQFFKPMKDDAYRAHKTICDREKAMLAPLRNAEQMVKRAMNLYTEAQERRRREEEEALRKAAQAEADRKLAEAAALEKAGDAVGAETAMMEAEIMDDASRFVVPAASTPKAAGVSVGKDWEIVDINSKEVPLAINGVEIRPVDRAAVMRLIRASKGKIQIPGIQYKEVAKTSFRRY